MIRNPLNRSRGVALIQTLVLAAIFMIACSSLIVDSRSHLNLANRQKEIWAARLALETLQAQILFDLLTESNSIAGNTTDYNFYGRPFDLNGVTARLIDHGGLLHAWYPDPSRLMTAVRGLGVSENQAIRFYDTLIDWQDIDNQVSNNGAEQTSYGGRLNIRNGAIPDLSELTRIQGFNPKLYDIMPWFSMFRLSGFNPMHSPDSLLRALIKTGYEDLVLDERKEGTLTRERFSELSGISESTTIFFTRSNILTLSLEKRMPDYHVARSITVKLSPDVKGFEPAVNILEQHSRAISEHEI